MDQEVDHSFFDSDNESDDGQMVQQCPDGAEILQIEEKTEEVERPETENEGQESTEFILKEQTLCPEPDGQSQCTNDRKEDPKGGEGMESGREDSDTSSRKPLLLSSSKSSQGSQSDDSSSVHSNFSDSSFKEEDDEAVLKNDDGSGSESDDREKNLDPPLSEHLSETNKKSPGKFRNKSHSPSSSSSSSEDENYPSGNGRIPCPSPKQSFPQATASPPRRTRPNSANRKEKKERVKVSETTESEDTVTDVTPLSTPEISPGQSFDLTLLTEPTVTLAEQELEFDTEEPSVTEVDAEKKKSSDTDGEEKSAVLSEGGQVDSALVISSPSSASSSSCSRQGSTNGELRRIEQENLRILRELSPSSERLRRGGSARTTASTTRNSGPPTARMYHSALNRQREQQRIQRENQAMLKRLESVKATPGMARAEQLADYERQAGYIGTRAPLSRPPSGKGSRPCSLNSTNTRPAWS